MRAGLMSSTLVLFWAFFFPMVKASVQKNEYQTSAPNYSKHTYAIIERQSEMIEVGLTNIGRYTPIAQAFVGEDAIQIQVQHLLNNLEYDRDAAFRIVVLMRILLFSHNTKSSQQKFMNTQIMDKLQSIPFWITPGESTRVYWTENQQSIWLSSAWLLYEYYGIIYDNETNMEENPGKEQEASSSSVLSSTKLKQRLIHYLQMKVEFGFMEYFSSVYLPYTLSGLLNLVDFCQDEEIRTLAVDATIKLLDTILLVTNDRGCFFAASGKNYVNFYLQNNKAITGTIWLLTGLDSSTDNDEGAAIARSFDIGTAFLATSSLDVTSIVDRYYKTITNNDGNGMVVVDTSIDIKPSLADSLDYNTNISKVDRIMFQWSMGGYFHPDLADDTQWLLNSYDLWHHGEFQDFTGFDSLPSWLETLGSKALASITRSSVITGRTVNIFRFGQIVLSSVQNFYPGRLGYEVYPVVATTGTVAIWLQSGRVEPDWSDRPDSPSQAHLPYIEQKRNVALVMYNPNNDIDLIQSFIPDSPYGVDDFEVALRWPGSAGKDGNSIFDEELDSGRWKIGREGDGYIAVARHCLDVIHGIPACLDENQLWGIVVGNSAMYGSFDAFVDKIQNESSYESSYSWNFWTRTNTFEGTIGFDGIHISHRWQY
jgi:hypothetical protein